MRIESINTAERMSLQLSGRFDFSKQKLFMNEAERAIAKAVTAEFQVDLAGLEYIDSSGLGSLLMVRDMAKHQDKFVTLTGQRGQVKQALSAAQFERLFAVS